MKLKLILTTAILGTALAVPNASRAQAPALDSATGDGPGIPGPSAFAVNATSGPSGENPTGTVRWHLGGGNGSTWNGNVSCLSVSGNTAIIGFGESYFSLLVPFQVYWVAGLVRVVDNGPGPGDTFEFVELQIGEPGQQFPPTGDPLPGPTDCSSFPSDRPVYVIALGGFVVTDAQPFPTTKDQCKNGGWRNYPQFENQGQCIAFVNHGS